MTFLKEWFADNSRIYRTFTGQSRRTEAGDARQAEIMRQADLIEKDLEMSEWALQRGVDKLRDASRKEVTKLWG